MCGFFQDKDLIKTLQGLEDCISMLGEEFRDLVGTILVSICSLHLSSFYSFTFFLTLTMQVGSSRPWFSTNNLNNNCKNNEEEEDQKGER